MPHNRSVTEKLLSGGAWSFAGQLFTALAGLLLNVLLARLLAPGDLGAYFLIFSMVSLLAVVAQLGFTHSVVRFVAEAMGSAQKPVAKRAVLIALRLVFIGAVTLACFLMFGGGHWVAEAVFHSKLIGSLSGLAAVWLVIIAFQQLIAEIYRGFHDIRLATVFGGVLTGAFSVLAFALLWWRHGGGNLDQAILISVGSGLASVLISSSYLWKKLNAMSSGGAIDESMTAKNMLVVSWPMLVSSLMFFTLSQVDLWVVGAFRPAEEVAIYGAALRMVLLITMPLLVMNAVVPPIIAELHAGDRKEELEKYLRFVSSLVSIPSVLLLLVFATYGDSVLELVFGEFYSDGAVILLLLGLGQVANVWAGSCGLVLMLTGHQVVMMVVTLISGALMVVAACVLVKPYGMTGVASAAACGMILQNLLMLLFAKKRTGIWTHASISSLVALAKKVRLV